MTSRAAERVNKIRKQPPSGVKRGRHTHWHSHACSSIKFPARVNSVARPCSPRGLFSESHPSATSYSNGLTGEEESVSAHGWGGEGVEIVVIDGPVACGGSWVYEPEQIWILRTRPPCHTRRIKNYLTMHYVGDLSRKKDERGLPCGHNHNLQWSKTLPTPLYAFKQGPIDTGPLPSQ